MLRISEILFFIKDFFFLKKKNHLWVWVNVCNSPGTYGAWRGHWIFWSWSYRQSQDAGFFQHTEIRTQALVISQQALLPTMPALQLSVCLWCPQHFWSFIKIVTGIFILVIRNICISTFYAPLYCQMLFLLCFLEDPDCRLATRLESRNFSHFVSFLCGL